MRHAGKLLVEDRDTAYLFLEGCCDSIPEAQEGQAVEIDVADVDDWEDENAAVWLTDPDSWKNCVAKLRVVPRDTVFSDEPQPLIDFDKEGFPIPTPIIIATVDDWNEHKADFW